MRALVVILLLLAGPVRAMPVVGLYAARVVQEAVLQGVPPLLADAVARVETGYNPLALGSSGEIGLMQVMPGTAAQLGFRGTTAELYDPATNIHYGVTYLARAWAASGGNVCRALMKYRAGVGEEGYSPLSILYCRRAQAWLDREGSPLAALLAASTPLVATIPDRDGGVSARKYAALGQMQDAAWRRPGHGAHQAINLRRRLQAALTEALPQAEIRLADAGPLQGAE